jgi:chemotaxis protein methyltransferase CheR
VNQLQLKDNEFSKFQSWLYEATGINLTSAKKALVAGRLQKRLVHHKLKSYGEYFQLIMSKAETAELQIATDLLTTNETYFFREPKHFDFLRQHILPQLAPAKPFRVWSAASSSGEEAYTIAMVLASELATTQWEVFGSDISTHVLQIAQNAHYPMSRASNIPKAFLSQYCLKGVGSQDGTFLIDRNLRARVAFAQINLNDNIPNVGEFDVIFLRNVMIYFDQETKRKVVSRMLPRLKPGGYFFISHSESLNGVTDALKLIAPAIYRKP